MNTSTLSVQALNANLDRAIKTAPQAHRPEWRRFTEFDWYGFAGASSFPNGDWPWIAEIKVDGNDAVAVVDANGIGIMVYPEPENADDLDGVNETSWYAEDANAILGVGARSSTVELERIGFKQC